jgi:putative peptidoglycan lipid II flippase
MIRGFRQIAFLTALSRIFGMLRDMAYSHFFGATGFLDAWLIAFRIPNLSRRLFGEGAASASLIPVYSEVLHKDPKQASALLNTVVTVMFMFLAALVLVVQLGMWMYMHFCSKTSDSELIMALSLIMLPYMLFICMEAILGGILNVHKHFAMPALAPMVLNFFIIGTIIATGWIWKTEAVTQLVIVSFGVLMAGFVQLYIQLPPLKKAGIMLNSSWRVNSEPFKKIFYMMLPMILGLGVTQLNTLCDDLIAWWFSGNKPEDFFVLFGKHINYPMLRGSVSHLYYAQRLYQLPFGVLGISLATAIFPVMSADAAKGDYKALIRTISKGLRGSIFIACPATAGIIIIAKPLLSVLFQHGRFTADDTSMVAKTLIYYSLGLCGYFAQQILAKAFYSMQDSKTPVKSALFAVFANVILNLTLIWFIGTGGLAAATAICSYFQVVILILILRRKLSSSIFDGLPENILKTLAGTFAMTIICVLILLVMKILPSGRLFDGLKLLAVVPSAIIVYILVAKKLRNEMLSLFTGRRK